MNITPLVISFPTSSVSNLLTTLNYLNYGNRMSIIDSSTTGHNRKSERKFSNKLFIGLIALVLAAIVVALIAGQKKELNPTPTENKAVESNSANTTVPPVETTGN